MPKKALNLPPVLPHSPDQFFYWFLAAISGALAGGYVFNILKKKDPV